MNIYEKQKCKTTGKKKETICDFAIHKLFAFQLIADTYIFTQDGRKCYCTPSMSMESAKETDFLIAEILIRKQNNTFIICHLKVAHDTEQCKQL